MILSCPQCGDYDIIIDKQPIVENGFIYRQIKCEKCGHETEFAFRSVQNG